MFGYITEEVTRGPTKLHDEELQNLYLSSNVRVIKSRTVRSVGRVACMKDMRNVTKFWTENLKRPFFVRNIDTLVDVKISHMSRPCE